jgi:hypothetical protein
MLRHSFHQIKVKLFVSRVGCNLPLSVYFLALITNPLSQTLFQQNCSKAVMCFHFRIKECMHWVYIYFIHGARVQKRASKISNERNQRARRRLSNEPRKALISLTGSSSSKFCAELLECSDILLFVRLSVYLYNTN